MAATLPSFPREGCVIGLLEEIRDALPGLREAAGLPRGGGTTSDANELYVKRHTAAAGWSAEVELVAALPWDNEFRHTYRCGAAAMVLGPRVARADGTNDHQQREGPPPGCLSLAAQLRAAGDARIGEATAVYDPDSPTPHLKELVDAGIRLDHHLYSANYYAATAVSKIDAHAKLAVPDATPLFLYLPFQNMHAPYQLPPAWEAKTFPAWNSSSQRHTYGNMLHLLDEGVRNVTGAMQKGGLWAKTLVVFSADNGGIGNYMDGGRVTGWGNNYPLRGHKHDPYEGGVRSTSFVTGGFVPPKLRGTVSGAKLVHVSDWFATFSALAGVDLRDDVYIPLKNGTQVLRSIDSVNVWPILIGTNLTQPRAVTPITEASIISVDGKTGKWWKLITKAGNSIYYEAKTGIQIPANGTCLEGSQPDPPEPGRTDAIANCFQPKLDPHVCPICEAYCKVKPWCGNCLPVPKCCAVCNSTHPRVYDLLCDPQEKSNVAAQHPEVNALLAPILAASNEHYVSGHLPQAQLERDYEKLDATTVWGSFVGPCWKRKPKKLKSDDGNSINTRAAWKQQRFAITFLEFEHGATAALPAYYKAIASLNFTVAEGWGLGRPLAAVESNLAAAADAGLDSIVSGYETNPVPLTNSSSKSLLGFLVKDEPSRSDFAQLANWTRQLSKTHPGKLRFINLLPNCSASRGSATYTEYVKSFVETVRPDLVAFDMYPIFSAVGRTEASPAEYVRTLALYRSLALSHQIRLWNYFRSTDFSNMKAPGKNPATEAEMRWQTLTSLAYGATGAMYFNYPPGAIVSINGTLGPLAAATRRINTLLLAYAPHLLRATSTDVWLVPAGGGARTRSSGGHQFVLGVTSKEPSLVGSFRLKDGRAAALIQNQNWKAASACVLTFARGLEHVRRVDPATGAEVAVETPSARLAAGGAELYVAAAS